MASRMRPYGRSRQAPRRRRLTFTPLNLLLSVQAGSEFPNIPEWIGTCCLDYAQVGFVRISFAVIATSIDMVRSRMLGDFPWPS